MSYYALTKRIMAIKLMLVAAALIALAGSSLGQAGATATPASTSPADAPYVASMTFDVASVRENKDTDSGKGFMMGGQFAPHTTHLHLLNLRTEELIGYAYGINQPDMVGFSRWPSSPRFVIDAKGDSDADAKMASLTSEQERTEQQHMVQALLEERFKLKARWETKQMDIFDLVVAKGGPKLGAEGSMPPSPQDLKIFGDRPIPVIRQKSDGHGHPMFVANGCSTAALSQMLTAQLGLPVIDKTGLTGRYDFALAYKGRFDRDRPADDPDPTPPMDRARQGRGLKGEAAMGPARVLVIDHIEKPSGN